jgi:hypothetical protein
MIARALVHHAAAVVLGLAIASSGCVAHFQPTLPMAARSDDLRLDLKALRVRKELVVVFHSDGPAAHIIRTGWLTVPTRAPCSGGQEINEVAIDGVAGAALPAGRHEVTAAFDAGDAGELDLVVDLQLDEGDCARAPAISQSIPMVASSRFAVVVDTVLDGFKTLRGVHTSGSVRLGGGVWLGPVLASASAGLGITACEVATCGENQERRNSATFPVAADLRYGLPSFRASRELMIPFVGARYTFMPVRADGLARDRRFDLHGFHALFALAAGPPLGRGPFLRTERTSMIDGGLTLGVVVDPDGPGRRVGFSGGLAFRIQSPL